MITLEQQAMFKVMGAKTFYIGEFIWESKRATVMIGGPENVLFNVLTNTKQSLLLKPYYIFMKEQKSQDG